MGHYAVIAYRTLFGFVFMLFVGRVLGQKFDTVSGFVLAVLTAITVLDSRVPFPDGIIALVAWTVLSLAVKFLSLKSSQFNTAIHGKPTVLIDQGKVLEKNLRKANLSLSEMLSMLRQKDAFKLSDVEFGVLENDGTISVLKKSDVQPVTPTAQGLTVPSEQAPNILILDGQVQLKTLEDLGYSQGWLLGEILKQGATDYNDVFVAQVDSSGNVFVDLKNDPAASQKVQAKPLLLASLKKIQADLENFSAQTQNEPAKTTYQHLAHQLQELIGRVQPYLRQ
ncbi:DUF421 domain-containing protein [Alicyclobacillus tolerans]|uniref:DUF421 domain-containing protein n=1 Tax=Alicyclobacillus tolerans TaxID=90970 RepID=UPI001F460E6F|nr:DUF421 domain-containing protein [Alicyclobacillus tolerans]MCF8563389.1 DUF421 domain-containing protein [Alicyclobacillus tolerans]